MHSNTSFQMPPAARGSVAIIANHRGELLLHLRDDLPTIAWPGHWSLLGGSAEGNESAAAAIVRELQEEAALTLDDLTELFTLHDPHNSGKLITFFAGTWDGDETRLPLAEGAKLQFFPPCHLDSLMIPPLIRDGIHRYLSSQPAGPTDRQDTESGPTHLNRAQ
ncbi:NUDIX domain-containing protein [Streptomyces sp. NPDC047990]|uniref:NUDIX domain-containing protein n=1 Tax=Streptomyces sp. NPDC047990 TaxID=3365496 RepID=UPI003711C4DD